MEPTGPSPNFEYVAFHEVVEHDEYWFDIDEYRLDGKQFLLTHIAFEKFSPKIYKQVLHEWECFRKCVKAPLYAMCDDGDPDKWERFVSRLGFKPTGINIICNNGAKRQLFISTVDA